MTVEREIEVEDLRLQAVIGDASTSAAVEVDGERRALHRLRVWK